MTKFSGSRISRLWRSNEGFTLIELAVVMVIISILATGALMSFSAQVESRRITETEKLLSEIREALIGFALANDRLPCPATAASAGDEAYATGGSAANGLCADFFAGFVPGRALGITPIDNAGYVLDPWGNRIRYGVTNVNEGPNGSATANANTDFTATGELRVVGLSNLSPNLRVCSTVTGSTATNCAANATLTTNAVAVVYSTGPNGATPDPGGVRIDEAANPNVNAPAGNAVYVSHERSGTSAPNGEFDDLVTWISPNILYARLVSAGRLP